MPDLYASAEDRDGDFNNLDECIPDEAFAAWRVECETARRISAAASLDDISAKRNHHSGNEFSLRWILTHMIEEYARHNGHADLLREAIDGTTGD